MDGFLSIILRLDRNEKLIFAKKVCSNTFLAKRFKILKTLYFYYDY